MPIKGQPTGPKLKERLDLGELLRRKQEQLRSVYPDPPLTWRDRLRDIGRYDWMDFMFMIVMACATICMMVITIAVVMIAFQYARQ